MFTSIRRHQKWLWFVIAGATIISFVSFFSPRSQRFNGRGRFAGSDSVGTIYGRPVSREEYLEALREVHLLYRISYGRWPDEDEMARQMGIVDRETASRLVKLQKMKDLGIHVGEAAAAQWISDVFRDPNQGGYREEIFRNFVAHIAQKGLSRRDLERFARNEAGLQHLNAVIGLAGKVVTPQEAEASYRAEHEQMDTKVIVFNTSNYLSKVTVDAAALESFYTNRQSDYRIPEKVQISYVKFPATNYFAVADQRMLQESNKVEQFVNVMYEQRGTNMTGTNGLPLGPIEAKQRLREEARDQYALIEAQKKANEFLEKLLEMKPVTTTNIDQLASAMGLQAGVSVPFSQFEEPPGLDMPPGLGRTTFQLGLSEPYLEQPVVSEKAVYIVGLRARHPSVQPPLDQVREKVTDDFKKREAATLANNAGRDAHRAISAARAQGKTFDAAAAEAQLEVIDLPPFSQKTLSLEQLKDRSILSSLKDMAFTLMPGDLSEFVPAGDGGFIVYIERRVGVTPDELKTALPEYFKTLQRSRQFDALSEWMRKEMELARVNLPEDRKHKAVQ